MDGRAGARPRRDRRASSSGSCPGSRTCPAASAQGGRLDVTVKGYRYYWNYTYPNGVIQVDQMRAPAGRNVRLEVSAPDFDVIHSWWIPALGGKFDAIPGETNETWFNANAPGIYRGQCAEFCGIQHTVMKAEVDRAPARRSSTPGSRRRRGPRRRERRTSASRRSAAPARSATGSRATATSAPALRANQLLDDDAAIDEVVRNGRGEMPPVGKDWTERQMDALIEYLDEELLSGN